MLATFTAEQRRQLVAADLMKQHGVPTHTSSIDLNASKVRVYNLPDSHRWQLTRLQENHNG